MKNLAIFLLGLCSSLMLAGCHTDENQAALADDNTIAMQEGRSIVAIETNYGPITVELFNDLTPKTVDNFIQYMKEDFYNETQVHQVLPGFIIQAGLFDPDFKVKATNEPITNEADIAPSHKRGTVAMMRSHDPDSATSEFFINLNDNTLFDIPNGYAVFGHVIQGFEVLEKISTLPTCSRAPFYADVPCDTVMIEKVMEMS